MLTRRALVLITAAGAASLTLGSSALAGPTTPAPGPAPALTAEQIADRIQSFYDKTRTFKASFKQVYTAKAYAKTKEGVGQVILEKPGR